jgi:predicted acetyltransferase
MPLLVTPEIRYHRSLLEAVAEFDGAWMDGAGAVNTPTLAQLSDPAQFAELVAAIVDDRNEDAPRPEGRVAATSLWMVEGDQVVGFVQVRHRLNAFLLEQGGHIGYSVRPSARRRGLASTGLLEAIGRASALGLERVLVVADETNIGSRSVIESAGGEYENSFEGKRRYWIATS